MEKTIKRVGIIANCDKPDAPSVLSRVSQKAQALGLHLVTSKPTSLLLPDAECIPDNEIHASVDVLIAFGGDGTFLSAVRTLGDCNIPVMGVNLGSLGFMTSVPQQHVERALDALAEGKCKTSLRTLALTRIYRNEVEVAFHRALNDVVVGWGDSTRVVTLSMVIDDDEVTSYVCDGLILSTPTGSTGHQLSAGGPILHPETPAFAVNVICPHTLSARPLVVPDRSRITVHISRAPKELILSVDGQPAQRILQGDRIELARSPQPLQLLQLPDYSYFNVLRQKLGWRGSVI